MNKQELALKLLENVRIDEQTGCWIWTLSLTQPGYGQLGVNGKIKRTHRLSYELFKGPIPQGMFVCHHCDNRACLNPQHLFVGTSKENTRDMILKNRQKKPGGRKFTREDINHFRSEAANGVSRIELCETYHVSYKQLSRIINYRDWKNV